MTALGAALVPLAMPDMTKPNSSSNPYLITSAAELALLSEYVSTGGDTAGLYFKQTAAISLAGLVHKPIGTTAAPFCGTYDGGGQSIINAVITGGDNVGIFGVVGNGAEIRNLKVSAAVNVQSLLGANVGGIVGSASGAVIDGCSFSGTINVTAAATACAGGIVGYADDTDISNSTNSAAISSSGGAILNASGGIVGRIKGGSLTTLTNTGAVTAADGTESSSAGIAGYTEGTPISGCTNSGTITVDTGTRIAESYNYAAGIAGVSRGSASEIRNSVNSGRITSLSSSKSSYQYAGGIAGSAESVSLKSCRNTGNVGANNGGVVSVGGIAGAASLEISSCTSGASELMISGGEYNASIGGIAGEALSKITNCTVTGGIRLTAVSTGYKSSVNPASIGGIVGTSSGQLIDGCSSSAQINGAGTGTAAAVYGGGIAGISSARVINCSVLGDIYLSGSSDIAGGFVGLMNYGSSLVNSRSNADVSGYYAGVLAGFCAGSISNCYSTGTAAAGIGGGIGTGAVGMRDFTSKMSNCYWYAKNPASPNAMAYDSLSNENCALFGEPSGLLYTLKGNSVSVGGTSASTLLEALNAWVAYDNNDREAQYWTASASENDGYPVFGDAPGYTVTVLSALGGTLSADKKNADPGEKVNIDTVAASGYKLESLSVDNTKVTVVDGVTRYQFTMPARNVTVAARFTKKAALAAGEYEINVSSTKGGTVSVSKTAAKEGDVITLSVKADSGYRLASNGLKYNGKEVRMSANGYSFVMPKENVTVTASFVIGGGYNIKVADNLENGTIIVDRTTAAAGETVTFNAVPDEGYTVRSVTVNGEELQRNDFGAYTFLMPSVNTTLRAFFIKDEDALYGITVGETENGTITADKTEAKAGETVTLTLIPSEGYRTVDGSVKFNDTAIQQTTGQYSFVMPEESVVLTARFEEYIKYTVTVSSSVKNGRLTLSRTEAAEGDTVTVAVNPVPGYRLASNSLKYNSIVMNGSGTSYKFTMPASNVTITAKFELIPSVVTTGKDDDEPKETTAASKFVISLGTIKNGTVLVDRTSAAAGTTVKVTPKPNSGYRLKAGTLKANNKAVSYTSNGYSFTMPSAEVKIAAEFEKISDVAKYTLKAKSGIKNGTLSFSESEAASGTTITITVKPDDGYSLVSGSLTVNGTPIIPSGGSYRFVMPAENVTADAKFEVRRSVMYGITVESSDGGTVVSDVTSANEGDRVTLTVKPDEGYTLDSLKYNDTEMISSGETCSFIMPSSDVTVSAVFRKAGINDPYVNGTDNIGAYNVSVVSHSGGRIVKIGSSEEGDISFSITPDDGYVVSDVIVDNVSVGAVNSYTFEKITGEHTIEAFFAAIEGEEDAIGKIKSMMITAGIAIVSSVVVITLVVVGITLIARSASNRGRKRQRYEQKQAAKQDSDENELIMPDVDDGLEDGPPFLEDDGETTMFDTAKDEGTPEGSAEGKK